MTIEHLKLHLHITHNLEDSLLEVYQGWAESEIKDSVCLDDGQRDEAFFTDNKIFDKAVFLLTAYYYENRFAYSDVQFTATPDGVTGAIQKLRGAYPYESE